ncbi:hypothetical protein EFE32_12935 [Lactococcus lactis subsp. lactis]|uniref:hypothetical protein n=1 Tax=Lactococcus lactis TaxID=1358 RepID=UPI00223B0180|nr:hypothetical protein [Lactococcus lactis]MCT0017676.1 hypothetical protein [Lactococcus lactis subsp. lactis]
MGMYTDLRGAVLLKDEYVEAIKSYLDDSISDEDYDLLLKKYPILEQFEEIDRGGSGMFGLELLFYPLTEKEELFTPRVEENIWYFKAHIKDYLDPKYFVTPYEFFIKTLIPLISKEILLLETKYEEYDDYFDQWYLDLDGLKIKRNIIKFEYDERPYGFNSVPKLNNRDMFEKFKNEHGLEIWND